jgi:hypothetical protein
MSENLDPAAPPAGTHAERTFAHFPEVAIPSRIGHVSLPARRTEQRSTPGLSLACRGYGGAPVPGAGALWPWPCRRYCGACARCERAVAREVALHTMRQSARRAAADTTHGADAHASTALHAARFGAEVDELLARLARRRDAEAIGMLDARLQPLARAYSARLGLSGEQSEEATHAALSTIALALSARLLLGGALSASGNRPEQLRRSRPLHDAFLLTYDWPGWVARIVWNEHATIARRQLTPVVDASCLLIPMDDPTFTIIVARASAAPGVACHDRQRALAVDIEPEDARRKATLARGRRSGGSATLRDMESACVIATFSTPRRRERMAEILACPDRGERTRVLVVPDDPRRRGRRVDDAGTLVPIVEIYENDVCSRAQIALGNGRWPALLVRPRRDARAQLDELPPEHQVRNAPRAQARLTPSLEKVIAFVAELPFRASRPSNRRRVATDLLALCPEVQRLPNRCLRAHPSGARLAAEITLACAELSHIPELDTRARIALHIHGAATTGTMNNVSQVRSQLTRLVQTAGFGPDPSDDDPEDPELIYGWAWLLDRVW